MENRKIVNLFGFIVLSTGITVILGWIFDVEILKSLIPNGQMMKSSSALSFICVGVAFLFITRMRQGKITLFQIGLPALTLIIIMLLALNIVSAFFGSNVVLSTLFAKESQLNHITDRPSVGTLINFALIVTSFFFILANSPKTRIIQSIGTTVSATSGIAIIGFVLGLPFLYYNFENISNAMAVHTAAMFLLAGISLILIGKDNKNNTYSKSIQIKTRLVSLFLIISTIPISFLGIMTYLLIQDYEIIDSFGQSFIVLSAIGITTSVLFTYLIIQQIVKPITNLKNTALAISNGNLNVKAEESTSDEIGQLAKTFNGMINNIKTSTALETQRLRQKQESLNTISQITNALDEAALVSITDKNGTIIEVNSKFCQVSKYSRQELIGKNHRIIKSGFHPPEFYEDLWKTISNGKIWHNDIKNCAKDGTYYWVKTVIMPFFTVDGQIEKYVSIRTDITEQKRIEAELREKIIVEFELGKTIGEQKRIEAELREINKDKDEFSAMITHELKTPLIPISGYSELLLDGSLGNITEEQKEKIRIIYENSIRLSTLIQDILDARKLEMGKLNLDLRSESIKEIVKRCIDIFRPIADRRQIDLVDNTQDIVVKCDSDRILQVLNNVISNAIKFVPEKQGTISINSRIENELVIVSITDNGIGIPKIKQENLFKKFYQVDKSLTRKSGGTGLGLAISRGIIESHGGKIWVESEEGQGTRVSFSIFGANSN